MDEHPMASSFHKPLQTRELNSNNASEGGGIILFLQSRGVRLEM